jgi:hypothetical protein
MADFIFNIAKGKFAYYATLPAASDALILILCKSAGLVSDATLIDIDDVGTILAGATDEADFTGYSRKTLANVTVTVDDTNDRVDVDADDPSSYTNTGGSSQAVGKAIIAYDNDTGAGTDTNLIPLVGLDCTITFDISVATTLSFASLGFARAA